jgi:hypothetical protein
MTESLERSAFPLTGVVHLVRPVGREACDLEELRAGIVEASPTSLFYHALQPLLRFAESAGQPPDDFSHWVHGVVQDRETAERLAFALQTCADSPTELRQGLLGVLELMPEGTRRRRDAPEDGGFVFLDVDTVRVPTPHMAEDPASFMELIEQLPLAVLFYHAVEQPWLDPGTPTLAAWLEANGEPRLAERLAATGHSGRSLADARRQLIRQYRQSRLGRRLADASSLPDAMRREEGRRAMARLARRLSPAGRSDSNEVEAPRNAERGAPQPAETRGGEAHGGEAE